MTQSVYVIGGAGTGKSTFTAELLTGGPSRLMPAPAYAVYLQRKAVLEATFVQPLTATQLPAPTEVIGR